MSGGEPGVNGGEPGVGSSPEAALVTLRDWRLEDLDVYAHWMAPGHRWQDFDGPYFPKPTPEELAQELERRRVAILAGDWPEPRRRMVVADAATDSMLGTVSWYWLGQETNWLALGILVLDAHRWGRGLGHDRGRRWSRRGRRGRRGRRRRGGGLGCFRAKFLLFAPG